MSLVHLVLITVLPLAMVVSSRIFGRYRQRDERRYCRNIVVSWYERPPIASATSSGTLCSHNRKTTLSLLYPSRNSCSRLLTNVDSSPRSLARARSGLSPPPRPHRHHTQLLFMLRTIAASRWVGPPGSKTTRRTITEVRCDGASCRTLCITCTDINSVLPVSRHLTSVGKTIVSIEATCIQCVKTCQKRVVVVLPRL